MAYYSLTRTERLADELGSLTYTEMVDLVESLCDGVTDALSENDGGDTIIGINELAKALANWANTINKSVAQKQRDSDNGV